jgi:hypothetical protein
LHDFLPGMHARVRDGCGPDVRAEGMFGATGIHARLTPDVGEGDVRARLRHVDEHGAVLKVRCIPHLLTFSASMSASVSQYLVPGTHSFASPLDAIAIVPTRPA